MVQQRITRVPARESISSSDDSMLDLAHTPGGFGAEFRPQARQRRFVRETVSADTMPHHAQLPVEQPTHHSGNQTHAERLSHNPAGSLTELSRMADRVIEARDVAAAQHARAERAERELHGVNDRLLAARGLVHEAQRMAHMAAERTAFLEGRCEALERALDMSLNASLVQRWKWRRATRKPG